VWGIVPKLREVDAVMTPGLQKRVMEFHPELVWKRLPGRVLAPKHGARGAVQRLAVLAQHGAPWLLRVDMDNLPDAVALDDVLDCIVGLPVAYSIAGDPTYKCRLPGSDPPKDERGLRMEIWF
jgi:predicted RNase H-like nuclease